MSRRTETDLLRYAISLANDTYGLGLQIELLDSNVADARIQLSLADSVVSLQAEVKRWPTILTPSCC